MINFNFLTNQRIQIAWTASTGWLYSTTPYPLLFPSLSEKISTSNTLPASLNTSFSFFSSTL